MNKYIVHKVDIYGVDRYLRLVYSQPVWVPSRTRASKFDEQAAREIASKYGATAVPAD